MLGTFCFMLLSLIFMSLFFKDTHNLTVPTDALTLSWLLINGPLLLFIVI